MDLALTLKAKGRSGLLARVGTILSRFGPTPGRMAACLEAFASLAERHGAQPTWPITASVLNRHQDLVRHLVARGAEFAIHGLVHNDHKMLSLDQQRSSIARAVELFQQAGVPCSGFRGPYLRSNPATAQVLRELGLRYHSSQAVEFPVLPRSVADGNDAYRRALTLYDARSAECVVVRPALVDGLIDIPVAIPDDEIIIDRLHLGPDEQLSACLGILELVCSRGDLFTLQLHPERIFEMELALDAVLSAARSRRPAAWVARLDAISEWWECRSRLRPRVAPLAEGGYRVWLDGPPDERAVLLVRGLPDAPAESWDGADLIARRTSFEVRADVAPIVGVTGRTSAAARAFLEEEGFVLETSDAPHRFGAFVDEPGAAFNQIQLLASLERSPGPLVRLWRWPGGARCALAVTGDIDSITLQDFALRLWETRR